MIEGTVNGTVLGAHVDSHRAVLTVMDNGGDVHELVIEPQVAVLPDEPLLTWKVTDID